MFKASLPAPRRTAAATTLAPARGFAPAADVAAPVPHAGHDLARIRVTAPGPIQRAPKRKKGAPPPRVSRVVHEAGEHLRAGRLYEMGTSLAAATPAQQREFNAHLDRSGLRDRFTRATRGVHANVGSGAVPFRNATASWTGAEAAEVEGAFNRVPAGHRAGLRRVDRWRRAVRPAGDPDTEGGESFAADGRMRIYNQGVTGAFGAHLPASSLAGHNTALPAGAPGGRVGSLEYTATHELGHFVAASQAANFTAFKNAAGYREVSDLALAGHLAAYPGAAGHLNTHPRGTRVTTGEYEYRSHPDIPNHYLGTRRGAVPGSRDPAVDPLNAYAHTSPGEHFAELYAQMVHAPEMAHDAYVRQPAAAVTAAQAALDAHDATRAGRNWAGKLWNRRSDATARAGLQTQLAEAQAQQRVRTDAHRVMREQVFGVTPAVVAAKRGQLRGRNQAIRGRRQAYFDAHSAEASTPQQLDELHRQAMRVN